MRAGAFPRRWEIGTVLLITLLAATLRFYRLTEVPPGLHFDEGFKGTTARAFLQGAPPQLFFESDMGEEPIAMYLVAAALGLVGRDPWVIRLPSAIVGTLTIPLAWWLGRELYGRSHLRPGRDSPGNRLDLQSNASGRDEKIEAGSLQAQVVGLGTALVLAILYWHLSFSRIGMEPILVPFFAGLAFASLARGLNTGRWPAFGLAGVALGGSIYTYKAGYFVPILAILFAGYAAIVERGFLRRHGRGLLLTALVALIIVIPLGVYFVTHPASFLLRPSSVTVLGGEGPSQAPWQALSDNLPRVLGMFFVQGDANPRSNLPGRPALDPFLALLFLIGTIRALFGFRRPLPTLPLLWLAVMVLPTLITEHAPHFGRAIGATPALALLCAWGGWTLWQRAGRLERRWVQAAATVVLGLGLAFSGLSTAYSYFQTWGRSPDLFYAYDVGLAQIADYINARPPDEDLYLTPTDQEHYTLQYLIHRPFATFDGRAGLVFPPPGQKATILILLREDEGTLSTLQRSRPDGEIVWTLTDDLDRPYAAAYHLPASDTPAPSPDYPAEVLFDGKGRLLGYSAGDEVLAPGDTVHLTLYWQAVGPFDDAYTVFTHLLGEHNPATNGPVWAGHDSPPDGGHYPTTAWRDGEFILDVHPLSLPANTPPGNYQIEVGIYHLETMTRLPATSTAGHSLPGDAAILGALRVVE